MGVMTRVGECAVCHETRVIFGRGRCQRCYMRERLAGLRGPCGCCGRVRVLQCRGVCQYCRPKLAPGATYAANRCVRTETPEQIAAAKAHEQAFLDKVLPAVRNLALKIFARWDDDEREEALAEVSGIAWRYTIRMLARGVDPAGCVGCMAKWVVKTFLAYNRLVGKASLYDPLSLRAKLRKGVRCVRQSTIEEDGYSWERRLPTERKDESNTEFEDWAENKLTRPERELLRTLRDGATEAEAAERFHTTPTDVREAREQLCRQFLEYARS